MQQVYIPLSIALAIASDATPSMGLTTAVWALITAGSLGGSHHNIVGPTGAHDEHGLPLTSLLRFVVDNPVNFKILSFSRLFQDVMVAGCNCVGGDD